MRKKETLKPKDKLFNPNYVFTGDQSLILRGYPKRSQHLERYADLGIDAKKLNSKFIKDGYIYLLRGAKHGQDSGFYSREYSNKNTLESLYLDPNSVAEAQSINGNTPFISVTTDFYMAASFSNLERIYIVKVPIEDVYTFFQNESLREEEYMIPDYISAEEIICSFRYDKFKQIYYFLKKEIGLDINPRDLGQLKDIDVVDMERIKSEMIFNNSASHLDCILDIFRDSLAEMKLTREQVERANSIFGEDNCQISPQFLEFLENQEEIQCELDAFKISNNDNMRHVLAKKKR